MLSAAVAVTATEPATVVPAVGALSDTVGGVVSAATLFTVTLTAVDVVTLPATSRATALSVCTPLLAVVLFQAIEYGAVVSSTPRLTPSSLNCTPATAMLSAAVAVRLTVPVTVPAAGAVSETVGGVVSATTLFTVTLMAVEVVTLPAASRATALSACAPLPAVVVSQVIE